jgi:hypothetical protein
MKNPKVYEVQVRLRLRVLASDEDEAAQVVSTDVVDELVPVLDELHGANPRLAGWCVHADELVEELD